MNKNESLLQFFSAQSAEIPYGLFLINFVLAAVLAHLLGRLYARFGHSLSNREMFGRNFMVLSMTTMLIITIVKSSLALSLGLVGALSIIRFRTAVKEPEELGYLFICIAIGLGLGAQQTVITLVAFAILSARLCSRSIRVGSCAAVASSSALRAAAIRPSRSSWSRASRIFQSSSALASSPESDS